MKKTAIGIFFLLLFATLPLFSQQKPFYEGLTKELRLRLSEGYESAAERWESLGLEEKARSYRKMAEELTAPWSELQGTMNSEDAPADTIDPDSDIKPNELKTLSSKEETVLEVFEAYKMAFFSEDLEGIMELTAEPFFIPFSDEGMTSDEVREMYATIFDQYPVNENDADTVFRDDSTQITEMENGYYRIDIRTNDVYDDYFFSIPFWDSYQSYYFILSEDGEWRLAAISATESSF